MKYIILQNTLAPYRISLFNRLYRMGLDLELLYMEEMEYGRSWKIDYDSIKYPYHLDRGVRRIIRGYELLWNPGIFRRFRKERDTVIVLGGSWNMPNVVFSCILKRLGLIRSEVMFWSEANCLTNGARKKNLFRDLLRSFVLNTGEGRVIVPGQMAIETFSKWGLKGRKFHVLPNVIEEERFAAVASREKKFTPLSDRPRFVMSIRLIEQLKGFMNFFQAIGRENVLSSEFILIGSGPDEGLFRRFIKENGYEDNIRLLGFCDMDTVAEEYSKADALILPSFSDPSPLALVEGICCKLPLLASTRCGNHYETVVNGLNGYTFDPDDHAAVKDAFESLMNRRNEWPELSRASRELFERNFKQDKVLGHFIESLSK